MGKYEKVIVEEAMEENMKVKINRETTIEITLTEDQAKWLNGLMQKPIGGMGPKDEQPRDKQMRKIFWKALSSL